ncbi:hypothetical protein BDK51DRAFT_41894 [Blyttiomyces helicus]|uniref:Uncharacterized protein n=1 Tax=Blyttiomyces helicus TaxID=388810 RepID=A0A4V1IRQ0_9FUNG|nr:hypothetical protein BDK51DRAFT_41894 [Blyttiomyces helicus]|eukprot:RKO90827.1 hypothetical protein BDK51DRAFT_41894 [Blyttiomyces helicus]
MDLYGMFWYFICYGLFVSRTPYYHPRPLKKKSVQRAYPSPAPDVQLREVPSCQPVSKGSKLADDARLGRAFGEAHSGRPASAERADERAAPESASLVSLRRVVRHTGTTATTAGRVKPDDPPQAPRQLLAGLCEPVLALDLGRVLVQVPGPLADGGSAKDLALVADTPGHLGDRQTPPAPEPLQEVRARLGVMRVALPDRETVDHGGCGVEVAEGGRGVLVLHVRGVGGREEEEVEIVECETLWVRVRGGRG